MDNNISSIIKHNLCTSCGLCTIKGNAKMVMKKGILLPVFNQIPSPEDNSLLYNICPGKGYSIVEMGRSLYLNETNSLYNTNFGYYSSIGAATSNDDDFLKYSSSGGMIPTLAYYLLEQKLVDGIVTVKFEYGKNIKPKAFIAKNKSDIIESQGSKYLPVPLWEIIETIFSFKGTLAVIGTPCQIAGIRLYQKKSIVLLQTIKYTISNFCGGYRDFRETKRLFDIYNVDESSINFFSYRGDGQPGFMTIKQDGKNDIKLKYPSYSKLTGYIKAYRCRTCVDATGELADITFGDAWLKKYLNSDKKWSFYISRTHHMNKIISELTKNRKILTEVISEEELYTSQRGNLTTKKLRQESRYKLYKYLGKVLPNFDGGYMVGNTNFKLEIKVHIAHNIMYLLEKMKLFSFFNSLIRNKVKKN